MGLQFLGLFLAWQIFPAVLRPAMRVVYDLLYS